MNGVGLCIALGEAICGVLEPSPLEVEAIAIANVCDDSFSDFPKTMIKEVEVIDY